MEHVSVEGIFSSSKATSPLQINSTNTLMWKQNSCQSCFFPQELTARTRLQFSLELLAALTVCASHISAQTTLNVFMQVDKLLYIVLVPLCLISKIVELRLLLVGARGIIRKFPWSYQKTSLKLLLNEADSLQMLPSKHTKMDFSTKQKSDVRRKEGSGFRDHNRNTKIKLRITLFFCAVHNVCHLTISKSMVQS